MPRTLSFDTTAFEPEKPQKIHEIYASGFRGVYRDEVAERLYGNRRVTPDIQSVMGDRYDDAVELARGRLTAPYLATLDLIPDWGPAEAQLTGDCCPPGTLVRMADGTEKPIEQIREGEHVVTHLGNVKKVLATIAKPYEGDLVTITAQGMQRTVSTTPDHLFATYRRVDTYWKLAGTILPGDRVIADQRIDEVGLAAKVIRVDKAPYCGHVYCLVVDQDHSFLANGYAIHNCVGHFVRNAGELEDTVDAKIGFDADDVWPVGQRYSVEVIYGCRGWSGQGANCATLVSCVSERGRSGYLVRGVYGRYDLSAYNSQTARLEHSWGRSGPPRGLLELAAKRKAKVAIRLSGVDDVIVALTMGMGVGTCGSRGFSSKRNSDGVSGLSGSWSHSMLICGVDLTDWAVRTYGGLFLWKHDWGRWNSGPLKNGQPEGSWWVTRRDVEAYLRNGSYHAIGNVERVRAEMSRRALFVANLAER